jgi:SAM-dependent methyltransferase
MAEAPSTIYDEVPYPDNVYPFTQPDHLATMATLFGMRPVPPEHCRVLELGCSTGSNLIPMALTLPGSRFVGIDQSPRQIETGQDVARALGLTNIELQTGSILKVDAGLGEFDYIVCHGVYSWVPPQVQDKLLAVCKENLAPNGVAYVSYNTYPGWHLRAMVREMMLFHTEQFPEAVQKVAQARALLDFLIETAGDPDSAYGKILRQEAETLGRTSDAYLFHEHFEEVNIPVYFHEFAARAAAKGLQYLAEARPLPLPSNLTPHATATLQRLTTDRIHGEQYLDFMRNRTLRCTLLCHEQVALKPPSARAVLGMQITGLGRPTTTAIDLGPGVPLEFGTQQGVKVSLQSPLLKAALLGLATAWPAAVPFAEVWDGAHALLARNGHSAAAAEAVPEALAGALLKCFLAEVVELHVHAARFAVAAGERPVASPLARLQAARSGRVTSLRHRNIELNGFERQLLGLLDGSRDCAALLDGLVEAVAKGEVELKPKDGQPLTDPEQARALMAPTVEPALSRFASWSLLLA